MAHFLTRQRISVWTGALVLCFLGRLIYLRCCEHEYGCKPNYLLYDLRVPSKKILLNGKMNKYNSPPIILSTILKYLFEMRYLKYTNKFLHLIIPFKNKET